MSVWITRAKQFCQVQNSARHQMNRHGPSRGDGRVLRRSNPGKTLRQTDDLRSTTDTNLLVSPQSPDRFTAVAQHEPEGDSIFERLGGALSCVRQHRVSRVTDQCDAATSPLITWLAVSKRFESDIAIMCCTND